MPKRGIGFGPSRRGARGKGKRAAKKAATSTASTEAAAATLLAVQAASANVSQVRQDGSKLPKEEEVSVVVRTRRSTRNGRDTKEKVTEEQVLSSDSETGSASSSSELAATDVTERETNKEQQRRRTGKKTAKKVKKLHVPAVREGGGRHVTDFAMYGHNATAGAPIAPGNRRII